MLGTIVNALAIIAGSITGLLFSRGIPEHYKVTVQNGVGLSVVLIGVKSALVADNLLVWNEGKPPLTPVPETPWPPTGKG